jgi:fatty-acyl-CoA synthase
MLPSKFEHWPPGVPTHLPPITRTLDDNLRRAAGRAPKKTALIFYGAEKSYATLDHEVTQIAAYLQSVCGLRKGERVGLICRTRHNSLRVFTG